MVTGSRHFPHSYGFDPSYGMDLDQLLAIQPPDPPADFATFWRARYERARQIDPKPQVVPANRVLHGYAVHDLNYSSTDGVQIGGWLLLPEGGEVQRGIVVGHGYGCCEVPAEPLVFEDAAMLFPCFRGLGRSPVQGVSQDPNYHVLHDIQDRDRYILGGCVDDLWLGVSALVSLFPQVIGNLAYMGISFSGGIGALAAPWDDRISRLHLRVPTFGHQALRLTLPTVGSGEAVRAFRRSHSLNVMETLAYYDAAVSARYLRIPTLVAASLFDPAVAPPGQFAIYNAIPPALRQLYVLDAGHFDYPQREAQMRELDRVIVRFLTAAQ